MQQIEGFFWVLLGTVTTVFSACTNTTPSPASRASIGTVLPIAPVAPNNLGQPATDAGNATSVPASQATSSGTAATVDNPKSPAQAKANMHCPELMEPVQPGTNCGPMHCQAFSNERSAFAYVLSLAPEVIGIGESHAQAGSEAVHSATRRFAEQLLPVLCGRTKSIVLEIWLPRNDCGDKRVEKVEKAQQPVTATQAKSNKDEYVTLGHVAKRLGIEPSALVPTCEEYQSILDAGPDNIERMLSLIGERSGNRLIEELHRYPAEEFAPVVIAYGGALHNDAEPTPDHLAYSFGPKLLEETRGKYIELDLVVREFVKDTPAWQRQPWYQAFKKSHVSSKTLLYQWGEHSFALVFPESKKQKSN